MKAPQNAFYRARFSMSWMLIFAFLGMEISPFINAFADGLPIYRWVTLAGSASIGTADGIGANARFQSPTGITRDAAGILYVSDSGNNTIRKISPSGDVITWAGSNQTGGFADGPADVALFNLPTGVAFDPHGNLIVADTGNNCIRRIGVDRIVTTIAGTSGISGFKDGPGGSALFNSPSGLACRPTGEIVVADTGNNVVREILLDGNVRTLAGNPEAAGFTNGLGKAALFRSPTGLTIFGADVYVADTYNSVIRKITTSGLVSTFAGLSSVAQSRFLRPESLAWDAGRSVFLVSDSAKNSIASVTLSGSVNFFAGSVTGTGSLDGLASMALFNQPKGVCVDGDGNLFIVDSGNNTIRQLSKLYVVSTLAGMPPPYPKIATNGIGMNARFVHPVRGASDKAGNLYLADDADPRIRKVGTNGEVTTFAPLAWLPTAMAVDRDGRLLLIHGNAVVTLSPDGTETILGGSVTQSGTQDGIATQARFTNPSGLLANASGELIIADTGNHTLRKLLNGWVSTVAGKPGQAGHVNSNASDSRFFRPSQLAEDAEGTLFILDFGNKAIRKLNSAGITSDFEAKNPDGTPYAFTSDSAFQIGPDGGLIGADRFNSTIFNISKDGIAQTIGGQQNVIGGRDGIGAFARFNGPRNVLLDPLNRILVIDSDNALVRRGTFETTAVLSIVRQPQSISVFESEPASFSISATSSPSISYQWQRKQTNEDIWIDLQESDTILGATTDHLTITRATLTMSGDLFRCKVQNAFFPALLSDAAQLTVNKFILQISTSWGSAVSSNLLQNPSFELGLTNWNVASTSQQGLPFVASLESMPNHHQEGLFARTGRMFISGGTIDNGTATQTIDLNELPGHALDAIDAGHFKTTYGFFEASWEERGGPCDAVRLTIQFFDEPFALLGQETSPSIASPNPYFPSTISWAEFQNSVPVPPKTRHIRFQLEFLFFTGSDLDCAAEDAYFYLKDPSGAFFGTSLFQRRELELRWNSLIGRSYQVQWSDAPSGPWKNLGAAIQAVDSFTSRIDTIDQDSMRFYRVISL